jgi:hypothetical protein
MRELHVRQVILSLCAALFATNASHAQMLMGDTSVSRRLTPGVEYRHFVDKRGPFDVHLVRVNLRRGDIELRELRARGELKGRERPSEMIRRVEGGTVLAAVNADFFELKTGENENNQVIAGEWWKGLKVTDSPYDTYDNSHIQFGIDANKRPVMDRFVFEGFAFAHGVTTPIITENFNPAGKPEGTALYTARFGDRTPADTSRQTVEATLIGAGHHGDTLLYVRQGSVAPTSGNAIPRNGAVLSAYGAGLRAKEVQAMGDGDTIRVLLTTHPRLPSRHPPMLLIGGWPRILKDGRNVAGDAPTVEGTISRNAEIRHPRTAVGFSRDSSTLFLLTVDGRSENSGGMTLTELADMMHKLGAWQAMNFDGGGSTTMVIEGSLVNKPSDTTGEREVGNVLAVVKKP